MIVLGKSCLGILIIYFFGGMFSNVITR